jgi:hypothetical protein
MPVDILSPVTRNTEFSLTVTATPDALEIIESVTVTPIDKDLGIMVGGDTIEGEYIGVFEDVISFITKGSSDKLETPTTIIGTGDMPSGKTIFKFIEDTAAEKTKRYSILVKHDMGEYTEIVDHTVNNKIGDGMEFLLNYMKDN